MNRPIRLTAVLTHPVQYYAPWFRYIAAHAKDIDLSVLYATDPTPSQQGVGFDRAFRWDIPLTEGYRCRIVRPSRPGESVHSDALWGLDVPEIVEALAESRPDVALIGGWYSVTLLRALWACRRLHIPVLYRGDTHLGNAPAGWRRAAWALRTWTLLRCFDSYLSVGQHSRAYLRRFGAGSSWIFASPHCVDNGYFAKAAAPHQTPEGRAAARDCFGLSVDDFVVLFVGKLEPKKRPQDVIRAVLRLGPAARLLVVGTGPLEQTCREEAQGFATRTSWAGFLNQSQLGRAYAAADCLVLPSDWGETWGLTINEAMATGLPCVVSDRVGCAADLVIPGETGDVFPFGNTSALAAALTRLRESRQAGHDFAAACRARVAAYSHEAATAGLVAACQSVMQRPPYASAPDSLRTTPRVIACCGHMSIVFGMERMTFEVLRALRERGAAVHCVVNGWANWDRPREKHPIAALAERIGASWSTGFYRYGFERHSRNVLKLFRLSWDILRTSGGLLRDSWDFRPSHVFMPDFLAVVRNAPALVLLRMMRIPVVLRVGNHPGPGRFYRWIWGRVLPILVTRFAANSQFSVDRLKAAGVPPSKIALIRNAVAPRAVPRVADADVIEVVRSRRTVLSVGQIAPFKGTHLVIEAVLSLLEVGLDIQAVIVGPFPVWPADRVEYVRVLLQKVSAAGRQNRIHFVGERENVLEIMRAAYVFAAPILQEETFGNVVLEARSVGLPVVAFSTGGVPELVEHGVTGYLCADSSLEGLVEGLRYFLDDSARREKASDASLEALARSDSEYSRATFERAWWSLLQEVRRR